MSIKIEWDIAGAPGEDDPPVPPWPKGRALLRPRERVARLHPPEPETPPAPDQAPDASRESLWISTPRRRRLLAGLAVAFALVLGAVAWFVLRNGWQRVTDDVVALVRYEEQLSYQGEVGLVLRVQDTQNAEWLLTRAAQAVAYRPAPLPLPMLQIAPQPIHVQDLIALETDYVRADVYRQYLTPGGEALAYGLPQFYRRNDEGVWLRTSPPGDFWGELRDWESVHLRVRYHRRDEALLQVLAPQVEYLLAQTCRLWAEACAGLPPARLYLSPYLGSLEYEPLGNLQVRLYFDNSQAQAPAEPDYFVSIPSPHLAGLPADEAAAHLLAEYVAVRLIASLAEAVAVTPRYTAGLTAAVLFFPSHPYASDARGMSGDAQTLIAQAVNSLNLAVADPGFAVGED